MLASYTSGDAGLRWASASEAEHVAYVVGAMADIHGDVVYEQYTGEYNRRCCALDSPPAFEQILFGRYLVALVWKSTSTLQLGPRFPFQTMDC